MNIEEAKKISVKELLSLWGFHPVHETKDNYVYFSPFRKEKTPSFYVRKNTNTWKDFGSGLMEGDTVNLMMEYYNLDYSQALNLLMTSQYSQIERENFSFYQQKEKDSWRTDLERCRIGKIKNPYLINYIQWERGISAKIWKNQNKLFQMEYPARGLDGKEYIATNIAWLTDISSYELRGTGTFKRSFGPKHITTIFGETNDINIFEGFFSYLSALQYFNTNKLRNTTIVLNSLSNIPKIKELLQYAELVNLFLDIDKAGIEATNSLITNATPKQKIINRSIEIHPDYEDFNDFLIKKNIKKGLS